MRLDALAEANDLASSQRVFLQPGYRPRSIPKTSPEFDRLKKQWPYFGYVEVQISGIQPFVLLSNNDDRVAQFYFWYGPDAFEPLSLKLWRFFARRSQVILDIGAFTGVYGIAAAMANQNATVTCFEPVPRVHARLLNNVAVNRLRNRVSALNLALADTSGEATMNLYQGEYTLSTGSSLVDKDRLTVEATQRVEVARLDEVTAQRGLGTVDLAKLDVELAEEQVLDGGMGTIRRDRPKLLIEVLGERRLDTIAKRLLPLGYHYLVIDDYGGLRCRVDEPGNLGNRVRNALFLHAPPERLLEIAAKVSAGASQPLSR